MLKSYHGTCGSKLAMSKAAIEANIIFVGLFIFFLDKVKVRKNEMKKVNKKKTYLSSMLIMMLFEIVVMRVRRGKTIP